MKHLSPRLGQRHLTNDMLLAVPDVLKITALKNRVTLWRRANDPNDSFPKPYKLGPQTIRWKRSEIEAWMAQLEHA